MRPGWAIAKGQCDSVGSGIIQRARVETDDQPLLPSTQGCLGVSLEEINFFLPWFEGSSVLL